jgi:hypothetical protein
MSIVINIAAQNIERVLPTYRTSFLPQGSATALPRQNVSVPMRSPETSIVLAEAVKQRKSHSFRTRAGAWLRELLATLLFVGERLGKSLSGSSLEPEGS